MTNHKKSKIVTASTLTGLLMGSTVATAAHAETNNPQPSDREINIANPLQDYSSQDYADAYANLVLASNDRSEEKEDLETDGGVEYTLITETIEYNRYDADSDTSYVDITVNRSIDTDDEDNDEIQDIIADLESEHGFEEDNDQGGITTYYYKASYDRSSYEVSGTWADLDGNGIDTRNEVLWRDLNDVEWRENGIHVDSGWYIDPFINERIDFVRGPGTSNAVHIDHVLPIGQTWSDLHHLTDEEKVEFYNYDMNLIALDGPTNSSKGALAPASWMPPNDLVHCEYAMIWTHTSMVHDISLEEDSVELIEGTIEECFNRQLQSETSEMADMLDEFENGERELERDEIENYIGSSNDLEWEFTAADANTDAYSDIETSIEYVTGLYDSIVDPDEDENNDEEDVIDIDPSIDVSDTDVNIGDTLTIEGTGFYPNEEVEITLNSDPILLDTVVADENGDFTVDIVIPDEAEEGERNIVAVGAESNEEVSVLVNVSSHEENEEESDEEDNSNIVIPSIEMYPGQEFNIEGSGYSANEEVEIVLTSSDDTITVDTVESNEEGTFDVEITIPEDIENGSYELTATGLSSGNQSSLTIHIEEEVNDEDNDDNEIIAIDAVEPTRDGNTITIPEVEGLIYFVDGEAVNPNDNVAIPVDETVEITVEAAEGVEISEDSDVSWSYTYEAIEEDEGNDDDEIIENEAEISVEDSDTVHGGLVHITGSGFDANEDIEITIGEQLITIIEADDNGEFDINLVIPSNIEPGEHELQALGQSSNRIATVSINVVEEDSSNGNDDETGNNEEEEEANNSESGNTDDEESSEESGSEENNGSETSVSNENEESNGTTNDSGSSDSGESVESGDTESFDFNENNTTDAGYEYAQHDRSASFDRPGAETSNYQSFDNTAGDPVSVETGVIGEQTPWALAAYAGLLLLGAGSVAYGLMRWRRNSTD